jgi:DNA polymerase/3'-5' exonuclease PolX
VKATPKKNQNPANRTSKNSAKPAPRTPQKNVPSKKIPKDVAPKNEVKEMFMNWFKKHNQVGQIMRKQEVVREIIKKLDAKQEDALEAAMRELVKSGIIEVQEDGVTLVLTAQGAELLG